MILGTIYQNGETLFQINTKFPNGDKIYQIAVKLSKLPENKPTFSIPIFTQSGLFGLKVYRLANLLPLLQATCIHSHPIPVFPPPPPPPTSLS
jgi:hypothetical protein